MLRPQDILLVEETVKSSGLIFGRKMKVIKKSSLLTGYCG